MLGGTLFVCFVIQFDDRNQQYSIELIGFQRDFCWIRWHRMIISKAFCYFSSIY